jgi:hypothetical protein
VHLAKYKDGQFNFSDLLPAKSESSKTVSKVFPIQITHLFFSGGKLLWAEEKPKNKISEEINPIDLTVENFSLAQKQPFPLHLTMMSKSGAILDWQGEFGIDPLFSKGRVKLDQLKLQNLLKIALDDPISFDLQGSEMLEADYRLNYSSEKGLELEIPKSRFELKDFVYASAQPQSLEAKSSLFTMMADYKVRQAGQNWHVAAGKAEAKLQRIELAGFGLAHGSVEKS